MFDPTDGNPIVCFIDAPKGSALSSTLGTLYVRKYNGSTWTQLSQRADVRPLGCALAWHGTNGIVAWSEENGARWGAILAPAFGRELPHPTVQLAGQELYDVSIATHAGRIYFAYRTANPLSGLVTAPGLIVAGYFDGAAAPHIETIRSDNGHQYLGWGPQIIADDNGVALATIVSDPASLPPYAALRRLLITWGSAPATGQNIFPNQVSHQRFATAAAFDNLSDPNLQGILEPVFARPSIARAPDGALIAAYARVGPYPFDDLDPDTEFVGREGVATVRIDTATGNTAEVEVERRIGSDGPHRTEAVDVQLSVGPLGYNMVYRNPAPNKLVFASEYRSIPTDSFKGDFRCGRSFAKTTLSEAQLNLKYVDAVDPDGNPVFWTNECARLGPGAPQLERPYKRLGETIGSHDTLLRDVVVGMKIQDGRGPLRAQTRVCLPVSASTGLPDAALCDPDIGTSTSFAPAAETQTTATIATSPAQGVLPASITSYDNFFVAMLQCPPSDQILTTATNAAYQCIRCPQPTSGQHVYDPFSARCVLVNTAGCRDFRYNETASNTKARFLGTGSFGANRVFCMSCPSVSIEDASIGLLPWALTSDGTSCSRCSPGSLMYSCADDEDCSEFPNSYCSQESWGRVDAPGPNVCVQKCTSDADCGGFRTGGAPLGTCDQMSHKCVDQNGKETPSGLNLQCRPIGCDSCWRNEFCINDADCPANHRCYGDEDSETEPVTTPACVVRPVLSPSFITIVCSLAPTQCDEVKSTLEAQLETIEATLRTIRIPNSFDIGQSIPLASSTIVEFETEVTDIKVELRGPTEGGDERHGVVMLTLDMAEARLKTAATAGNTVLDTTTDGPFRIELVYALYTGPTGTNASMAYSGLGFSLIDVNVVGKIELPYAPNFISLSVANETFKQKLAPFGGQLMGVIVSSLGGLQIGDDGYFSAPDLLRCAIQPAVGPVPRQCSYVQPPSLCADNRQCRNGADCCGGFGYTCTGPKLANSATGYDGSCEPVIQQKIWNATVNIPYDRTLTMNYELCQ